MSDPAPIILRTQRQRPIVLEVNGNGGGGTSDYNALSHKPQIEGVTLTGNKTADDLGLAKASDIPAVPVQSVNGQTGVVVLDAEDVGALPNDTPIPTKTSDLENDSGFLTSAPVTSVNSKTGAVTLNASDVGAGTYTKPGSGIPKSDLASDVQTSLGKADSALQSAPVSSVNSKTGAVSLDKSDIGLGNVDNVQQYSASNPPPYPVTSVNGSTGAVTTPDTTYTISISGNVITLTPSSGAAQSITLPVYNGGVS